MGFELRFSRKKSELESLKTLFLEKARLSWDLARAYWLFIREKQLFLLTKKLYFLFSSDTADKFTYS